MSKESVLLKVPASQMGDQTWELVVMALERVVYVSCSVIVVMK